MDGYKGDATCPHCHSVNWVGPLGSVTLGDHGLEASTRPVGTNDTDWTCNPCGYHMTRPNPTFKILDSLAAAKAKEDARFRSRRTTP